MAKFLRKLTNEHHLWWPESDYLQVRDGGVRNLPCQRVYLSIPVHRLLHEHVFRTRLPRRLSHEQLLTIRERHAHKRCACYCEDEIKLVNIFHLGAPDTWQPVPAELEVLMVKADRYAVELSRLVYPNQLPISSQQRRSLLELNQLHLGGRRREILESFFTPKEVQLATHVNLKAATQ